LRATHGQLGEFGMGNYMTLKPPDLGKNLIVDSSFFGDLPCQGRPDLLLAQFPALDLNIEHARGYLTHYSTDDPGYEDIDWEDEHDPRNSPVRPSDGYGRLEGGVYWDFQNFLGVDHHAPVWRRFTTSPQAPTRTDK
ncbi:hypothetical protein ACWERW_35500, partial [Streptomyces sp. NPDC004012]